MEKPTNHYFVEGRGRLIQTFQYEITPYLKDSNAYGSIYFSRYFEWQGICREAWFTGCIYPDMLRMEGAFVTKSAHNEYKEEVLPFQRVLCLLNTRDIKMGLFPSSNPITSAD